MVYHTALDVSLRGAIQNLSQSGQPGQNAATRQYGDEFACAGLQYETSDEYLGYEAFNGGDPGLGRL